MSEETPLKPPRAAKKNLYLTREAIRIKSPKNNLWRKTKRKPKLFWNYAKSRVKTRDNISFLKREDETTATSASDTAETLNKLFASVFTLEDLHSSRVAPSYDFENLLVTIEITSEQVKQKLENLNPNKSLVHDSWHPHLLSEL